MAIGNPFGLGGNSVTVGVVSYKGRDLHARQCGHGGGHDPDRRRDQPRQLGRAAPQHPGRGHRHQHADHHAAACRSRRASASRCPSTWPRRSCPSSASKGKVVRGWLGVQIQPVDRGPGPDLQDEGRQGRARSRDVTDDSPAEKAGLKAGRRRGRRGRPRVEDNSDLSRYIASKAPGTTVQPAGAARRRGADDRGHPGHVPRARRRTRTTTTERRQGQLGMTLRNLTPDMAERLELPRDSQGRRGHRTSRRASAAEDAGPAARRRDRERQRQPPWTTWRDFEREIDQGASRTAWPACASAGGTQLHVPRPEARLSGRVIIRRRDP